MKINVFVIIFLSFIFSLNGLKNYSFEINQEQVYEKVHVEPLTFYNQDNLSNLEMFRYDDYRTILNFDLPSCYNLSCTTSCGSVLLYGISLSEA